MGLYQRKRSLVCNRGLGDVSMELGQTILYMKYSTGVGAGMVDEWCAAQRLTGNNAKCKGYWDDRTGLNENGNDVQYRD